MKLLLQARSEQSPNPWQSAALGMGGLCERGVGGGMGWLRDDVLTKVVRADEAQEGKPRHRPGVLDNKWWCVCKSPMAKLAKSAWR